MIILGLIFLFLPCIFVGLRVWAKWLSRRSLQADDYLIFGGLAFSVACSITQLIGSIHGLLSQHETVDSHGQPLLQDPKFLTYQRCKFSSQMLGVLSLGLTKLSLLVLFRNIFAVSRAFNLASAILIAITAAWTVSFFFSNLFTCYPITALVEEYYNNNCLDSLAMWYAGCITDVLIDLIIMVLPLPMVFKLQLAPKQKVAVSAVFVMGTGVIAISITRLAMYVKIGSTYLDHYTDDSYYISPIVFWTNIETALAVILACLPTLRPLWTFYRGRHPAKSASPSFEPYNSSSRRSGHKRIPETYNELDTINLIRHPER
ncbi:uncharacterized protein BO97DRAFT_434373 [Aspergillus homomorphus CBS 101889]|uniref:Rhodopsin domain-containing protein n=1 Tax=Aspergillus homomorphus (strain CBS 101889) TaxID=1450537 RepID=A0A395HZS9_ASPHC|nr:hypothetical protein BO97DRAFT_434373 [Aspergillus homomorphus CBS 101889]RAL12388.1 hypothetical protein BO97DRAFT_434373 [Aspergillus homomorphus CBS 101889]